MRGAFVPLLKLAQLAVNDAKRLTLRSSQTCSGIVPVSNDSRKYAFSSGNEQCKRMLANECIIQLQAVRMIG
jgi:hypothetical protein